MSPKKKSPKPIVVYDNNYMEAFYQTDYLAKKMMIASSLRCQDMDWKPEGCEIVMSSSELKDLSGLTKNSLKHLEKAVDKLHKTTIRIRDPKDQKHWISFNYLPKGEYKNGSLTLLINREMRPFIQNLQKNFTQYHIENIKPLKSGYSIRIFELLKMNAYKNDKKYRIKVPELRKMFGLEEKYKNYNDFKKYVILPAHKELKQHCEIFFEYREIKIGKKITEIEFFIFDQKRNFSDYEEVLEATIMDAEFGEVFNEKTDLEIELNNLGWKGDFYALIQEISKEAVECFIETLKRNLNDLDLESINPEQLHEYIDISIKTQAQKHFDLMKKSNKGFSGFKEKDGYSDLVKELYKLGWGPENPEKYIEQEGRGIVEEALQSLKNGQSSNIDIKPGLLRSKVKTLKIQKAIREEERKEIERINREKALLREKVLQEKKKELLKIYQNKVNQGVAIDVKQEFLKDFHDFVNDPIHEQTYLKNGKKTKEVLGSLNVANVEDLNTFALEEFLYWKGRV